MEPTTHARLEDEQRFVVPHVPDEATSPRLSELPAATVTKRRWTVSVGCADEFLEALEGFVLVEGSRPATPVRAVEVTDDERACGGALAAREPGDAAALIALARATVT